MFLSATYILDPVWGIGDRDSTKWGLIQVYRTDILVAVPGVASQAF
jgi:hypothetical protein